MPTVHEHQLDGEKHLSLFWPSTQGSTSASPVHRLAHGDLHGEAGYQARERVLTALELPGELLDYHFVMQTGAERLYKRRRAEPQHLAFVEWLAWFDSRLVEHHEAQFRITPTGDEYINVFALSFLVELHEREGHLHEALALAERFARFRPRDTAATDLRERVALLRAEHA